MKGSTITFYSIVRVYTVFISVFTSGIHRSVYPGYIQDWNIQQIPYPPPILHSSLHNSMDILLCQCWICREWFFTFTLPVV